MVQLGMAFRGLQVAGQHLELPGAEGRQEVCVGERGAPCAHRGASQEEDLQQQQDIQKQQDGQALSPAQGAPAEAVVDDSKLPVAGLHAHYN
jgi:hypothetical protein